MWSFKICNITGEEFRRARLKQKLKLSRYGRIDIGYWDNRSSTEIDRAMSVLGEIMSAEAPLSNMSE
jgi:hypothetical protein